MWCAQVLIVCTIFQEIWQGNWLIVYVLVKGFLSEHTKSETISTHYNFEDPLEWPASTEINAYKRWNGIKAYSFVNNQKILHRGLIIVSYVIEIETVLSPAIEHRHYLSKE